MNDMSKLRASGIAPDPFQPYGPNVTLHGIWTRQDHARSDARNLYAETCRAAAIALADELERIDAHFTAEVDALTAEQRSMAA